MERKTVTNRLKALLLGTVLAVGLLEVTLRLVGFEFQLYPTKVQVGWPDPESLRRMYRFDDSLLWVPKDYDQRVDVAIASPPPHLFMGCSCTEFGRYDEAFAREVDRAAPDANYSFINIGVGGWSSYQGLQQMREDVVRIKPEIVTIYYGWNDHWSTFGIDDKDISSYNLEHPALFTWATENLRLAQALNRFLFRSHFEGLSDRKRVAIEDFRSNLREMVALARKNGITPVLLTAPSSHQVGDEPMYVSLRWLKRKEDLVPLHREYVEAVREVAANEGAHLVDLFAQFAALDRATIEESFKEDGVHLTGAGDARIGAMLFESLNGAGLLDALGAK